MPPHPKFPTHFSTTRLTLQKPSLTDAPAIFTNYAQDPHVTRHLFWDPHTSVQGTEAFLQTCLDAWEGEQAARREWVILQKSAPELGAIGMVGFFGKPESTQREIGYVLMRDCWGQGLMTEVLVGMLHMLQTYSDFHRVVATHHDLNPASGRVMQKAGMSYLEEFQHEKKFPRHDSNQTCHRYQYVL